MGGRGLTAQAGWFAVASKGVEEESGKEERFNFGTPVFPLVDARGGGVPLEESEADEPSAEASGSGSANGERKISGAAALLSSAKGEGGKICQVSIFFGSGIREDRTWGAGSRRFPAAVVVVVVVAVAAPAVDAPAPETLEGLEGLRLSWAGEMPAGLGCLGVALSMFCLS